jgi:CBS domain-containing protein
MSSLGSQATVLSAISSVRPVFRESTLQSAVEVVREAGVEFVPVVAGGYLVGAVAAADLTAALLGGASPLDPVESMMREPLVVLPNATLAQAVAVLREARAQTLIVADADGRYVGVVHAMSLFGRAAVPSMPGLVGGMATPAGVYLTNGEVSGGAKPIALAITGALLFITYFIGIAVTYGGLLVAERTTGTPLLENAFNAVGLPGAIFQLGPVLVFLLLIRLSPISGTHAAEHMVVHAIERREPLVYEVVSRMPRVHPRCGTNIAVGAMMFLILLDFGWRFMGQIGPLFALAFTVLTWRSVGGVVQYLVTTKPPHRRQVEGAIAAANELIENYRKSARLSPNFWRRLSKSGLPFVMAGAMATSAIAMAILHFVGTPIPIW